MSDAPEVKPGYKTTEFWVTVATQVMGMLMASGAIQTGSTWDKILGLAGMVLSQLGYAASRSNVKAGQ